MDVKKEGHKMAMTWESLLLDRARMAQEQWFVYSMAGLAGVEPRKVSRREEEPVPAEDLAEYERIRALFAEVEASKFWYEDYEGGYLSAPRPRLIVEYAETEEEFIDRARPQIGEYLRRVTNGEAI